MAKLHEETVRVSESTSARDTIMVGCNIPNGFVMKCFTPTKRRVPVLGGGERDEEIYLADPAWPEVKLNGPAVPWGQHPKYDIKHGYAFTSISRAFWERWKPWNTDLLNSKSIIAADTQDGAFGMAKDFKDVRSGLQPLRRKKDPRVKINTRPEVTIEEEGEVVAD